MVRRWCRFEIAGPLGLNAHPAQEGHSIFCDLSLYLLNEPRKDLKIIAHMSEKEIVTDVPGQPQLTEIVQLLQLSNHSAR